MASGSAVRAGRAYVEISGSRVKLQRELRAASNDLRKFAQGTAAIGQKIAAAGLAMSAPFALAARTFGNFDKSMDRVGALSGASADEMARLTAEAQRLGSTTAFSASQAADAMSFFALAGFSVEEMLAAVGPTLDLAAAGQLDLADAADITAKIMRGMGLDVANTAGVIDILTKAATTSNTTVQQLGDAMKFIGPIAKSAGLEFEEVVAAVQMLSNAGIQGEMAGTTLRGTLLALASPSKEAASLLEQLGVSVNDASGNVRPLAAILQDLQNATRGMGSGEVLDILGTLFGARPAAGIATLLSQGADSLRDYTDALRDAGGTSQRIAEQQLDNLPGDVVKLKSAVEGLAIGVGQALDPAIRAVTQRVTGAVSAAAAWVSENQKAVIAAAGLAVSVTAVGAALLAVGGAAAIGAFAVGGLATAVGLLASPIALVAGALAGLGTIVATQTEAGRFAMDFIKGQVGKAAEFIQEAIGRVAAALGAGDIGAAAKIAGISLAEGLARGGANAVEFTGEALASLVRMVIGLADKVQSIIADLFSWIERQTGKVVGDTIQGFGDLVGLDLRQQARGAESFFRGGANQTQARSDFISERIGGGADFITGIIDAGASSLERKLAGLADEAKATAEEIVRALPSRPEGAGVDGVGSTSSSPFSLADAQSNVAGLGQASRVTSASLFNIAGLRSLGATKPVEERTAKATERTSKGVEQIVNAVLGGQLGALSYV